MIHIAYAPVVNANTMLTSSKTDAILCNLEGDLRYNTILSVSSIKTDLADLSIKRISFTSREYSTEKPMRIFALLSDDSVYVWEKTLSTEENATGSLIISNFQLTKHIHPVEQRDRFLESNRAQEILSTKRFIEKECDDPRNPFPAERISSVCFNYEGNRMIVTTFDCNLLIFDTCEWKLLKVFQTSGFKPIDCGFFRLMDRHDSKQMHCAVSVLTSRSSVFLLKIHDDNVISLRGEVPQCKGVKKQILGGNNHKLATVLVNGKVFIYDLVMLSRDLLTEKMATDSKMLEIAGIYEDGMKVTKKQVS